MASTRSILVQTADGRQVEVGNIPENAKITFGALQPGKMGGYGQGNALRIYTTTNNQLAVFVNVVWFRDLSLAIKERVTKKEETVQEESGPKRKTRTQAVAVDYDWVEA